MEIGTDELASSDEYIWIREGSGSVLDPSQGTGYAEFPFSVPAGGNYVIWGRVLSISGGSDSFFVSIDNGSYALWDTQISTTWVWDQVNDRNNNADPVIYNLSKGEHTLMIKQREDGTRLDKIIITNDADYYPN